MAAPFLDRLVPEHLKGVEPYVPSKPDHELMGFFGCENLVRLNNNENPLGPCPPALRAMKGFPPKDARKYPSGDSYYLRRALADEHGMDPDQFIVGNGANEAIAFVIKAFCGAGDNIITADKTFAVYEWVAMHGDCEPRLVPLKDSSFDFDGMLSRIDSRTKAIFICNPNNPTGSMWPKSKVEGFLERVGGRSIVVVDEAYIEYVEGMESESAMDLIGRHPNLVVFRTFSKMFALAGLRIGYLAADLEVANAIRRTCVVYSVNSLAQEAALATLEGGAETVEHLHRSRALAKGALKVLRGEFDRMGLRHVSGEGNFILVELPFSDSLAYRMLMTKGIMVRTMTGFRFPNWVRITCSHMDAMERLCETLSGILKSRQGARRGA